MYCVTVSCLRCALATVLGGIMGTTPIIVAIESSAGINDGAVQLCTACLPLIDVY